MHEKDNMEPINKKPRLNLESAVTASETKGSEVKAAPEVKAAAPVMIKTVPLIAKKQESELIIGPNPGNYEAKHGSASGDIWLAILRYFENVKIDTWVGGDFNRNLLEEEVRKVLHIVLASYGLRIGPEIEQLVDQCVIFLKKRGDVFKNPQIQKIDEPDCSVKDCISHILALQALPEDTQCNFIQLAKDPMKLSRLQLLAITKGQPTYALFQGDVHFITTGGQLSQVKTFESRASHFIQSKISPEELLAQPENHAAFMSKVSYVLYNNEFYLISSDEGVRSEKGKLFIKKLEKAENINNDTIKALFGKDFMELRPAKEGDLAVMESLLSKKEEMLENILLRAAFTKTEDSVEFKRWAKERVKQATGHVPHEDCIPLAYIEKLEELSIINKSFLAEFEAVTDEESLARLFKKYPQVVDYSDVNRSNAEDHIKYVCYDEKNNTEIIIANSQEHRDSEEHFRFPLNTPALIEHRNNMYRELLGVVLTEAMDFFQARGAVGKGKDKQVFVPPANLKDLVEVRSVNALEGYSRQEILDMGVPEEEIDNLLRPCKVPVRYQELLKVYQNEFKRSSELGLISKEDYQAFLIKIYNCRAFERLNGSVELVNNQMVVIPGLLKRPFTQFHSFQGLLDHLGVFLSEENMKKEFSKRIDKPFNAVFANQSTEPPKGNEKTTSLPGTGFPDFMVDGIQLMAKDLTQRQMNSLKVFIYRRHLLHPERKFALMFIEAGKQNVKLNAYNRWIETINSFVDLKKACKEHGTTAEYAYHHLMNEFSQLPLEVSNHKEFLMMSATQQMIASAAQALDFELPKVEVGLEYTGPNLNLEVKAEKEVKTEEHTRESDEEMDHVNLYLPTSPRSAHVSNSVFAPRNRDASVTDAATSQFNPNA